MYEDVDEHDCVISVGLRNMGKCNELKAFLLKSGYGVASVKGTYVGRYIKDGGAGIKGDNYFIVNLNNDGDFFNKLEKLRKYFCQEAILIIPKGNNITTKLEQYNDYSRMGRWSITISAKKVENKINKL